MKLSGEKGRKKRMALYPWITTYASMQYGNVPYNESPVEGEGESIVLPSAHNPEKIVIKKDLTTKLSDEAKEVITLILKGPAEVLEMFMTEKYHTISKGKIRQYLIDNGWKTHKVEKVFSELKVFVTDLEEID